LIFRSVNCRLVDRPPIDTRLDRRRSDWRAKS
jgi:hypothetical protein